MNTAAPRGRGPSRKLIGFLWGQPVTSRVDDWTDLPPLPSDIATSPSRVMERQNQPLTFDPSVKGGKHLDVCDVQEPFGGSSSSNTDGCAISSTMWDQRHEDSAAFSSDQSWTDEDDDEVPGPSHGNELEPDVEQDGAKKGGAEDDNKESEEDSASHQQDGEEEQRHKRLSPVEDALEHIRSESDKHFLQEKFISSSKGRGVFTREPIEKSSFVVEYRGEMSALKESRRKKSDCLNDYLFDFSWDGTNWRVDATEEDGSLGRLVNDDHRNPNCVMRKVDCEGRPHLCLFARRNIYEGEEITYNYGDSSYDWRSNVGLADSQELPAEVNKVLKKLKKDEVRSAVLSDSYIMHLAHCLCLMTTKNESADFINQNLRLVGRLLINLREKSINSMEEAFKPENFSKLVEDEVEPDVEQDNPEDPEEPEAVEEEAEDAEGSVKLSGVGNFETQLRPALCLNEINCFNEEALLLLPERKKRGQRKKKNKSESEEPEPEPSERQKSDTEKSENKTPEETLSCNFSDNEDMGFDMDVFDDDEDDVRNVENDGENDSNGSGATAERTEVKETTEQEEEQEEEEEEDDIGDGGEQDNGTDCEDDVAMDDDDGEKHEEEKDEERGEEQTDRMEVESSVSSDTADTEKKNRLLAIMRGMKEVKIIIRKLDMNLQPPIHITRLPSVFNKKPGRDRQRQTSSSPTDVPDKGVHMFCSNCKKSMMKGHTAFQKKGFTDVFCSKNCLFEKFPINKPNTKTCHYCHKAITQLLDLIMAVVDTKGTMKDFCNLTCVTYFKTNSSPTQTPPPPPPTTPPPPPLCSVCNKSCTTTVELTLQDVVYKFCSDSCLEVYCRDNMPACDNCSSFCRKQPLTLKLEEETKTICSQKCLEEFKEAPPATALSSARAVVFTRSEQRPTDGFCSSSRLLTRSPRTPMKCSVPGCGNVRTPRLATPQQKFHVFPSNPVLCSEWLEAIRNSRFSPKVTTVLMTRIHGLRVCSDHFRHQDYVGGQRNYYAALKRGAVPSLFPWTEPESGPVPTLSQQQNVQTHHKCTMCHTTRPLSDMVDYKSSEGSVELFCTRTCVTSYKLQPAIIYKLQGAKGSPRSKKRKMENSNSEDDHVAADSSVNENEASKAAESDITPTLIIAKSWVVCSSCGKRPPKGQMLYQPKSSLEVFCSASCLSERHPHIKVVDKTCYNCCQVIQRPHNIILAPVDDSGTMKELCSETCLSSVQSKRNMAAPKLPPPPGPRSECRMCARFLYCKFKLTLDGVLHKLCNEACFVRYHKVNDMPVPTCYACSSICADRRFMLPTDNGRKTICSEECLVKSKEKVQTLQLCPTCQTSHQLSDMVENRREDGGLDFFCSNRCMMVHRAQTCTVTESKNPSPEDANIKDVKDVIDMKEALDVKDIKDMKDVTDVKPSLPSLSRIKEEPIDEEYNQSLSPSVSTAGIKAETDVAKEDLKIGSVFSLMTDSAPAPATAPPLASTATPVATQRKGRTDIFCSTSCLLKFYQMKPGKRTCHFCLQVMTQTQDVLQGDTDGKVMEFCSQTCLSSFNYKKIMSTKIPIVPMSSHSQCSMCSRYCISKHEAVQHGVVHKLCSDTCFLRFSNLNKLSMCENCGSRCDSPLVLRLEDGSKKLCRTECLAQFKTKVQTPQPCSMCRCSTPVSDMVENRTSEDVVELFCSSSCVMASKIAAVSAAGSGHLPVHTAAVESESESVPHSHSGLSVSVATGTPVDCDNCERTTVPACHLAMSDASIRNFCSLSCAMAFKERQKDSTAPRDSSAASEQTQSDFLKAPNKLPCAQCRRNIMTTPSVVQKKNKTYFMCSPSCSQEFKKANNIMGRCEYCKNERIIRDVKRVDDRDCNFCSDGCLMLFRHELEKEWGKHCGSCSLCHCISRTLVTSKYDGKEEEFCSEGCNKIFNLLYCHLAKCDTCGRQGELRQSLHMLGEVKHFSDLKCLLHYCQKKLQMVDAVPSPLKPSGTAESSPVIANVISLASALARQDSASSSSSQPASTPDIQTKVIGHVSVQTVPKEVKNKSMLCTPLVHNKGVSCATQMVDTEAQTETFVPKVVVLPLPVPVYVPLPMNMYSQFTPKPVGLPVPLPVPVILPVASEPERSEGKLNDMSEKKTSQDEEKEREDNLEAGEETKEVGGEAQVLKDDTSSCREDVAEEDRGGSRRQEDSTGPPHSPAPPPPPPPALSQQTQGKAQNKGLKSSQHVEPSNRHKVLSHCGTEAWRRWTQWRESQADLDPGS
ncbi:hypothetical protein INR49_010369, partial [Caranx melampygus]